MDSAELTALLDSGLRDMPIRFAVQGEGGFAKIISLWYQYRDGCFYSVTHDSSWVLHQLKTNNQVGFEIAANTPPYKGIRGVGHLSVSALRDDLQEQLIDHYLGSRQSDFARWLLSYKAGEMVIQIKPEKMSTWDYTEKMQGITTNG